MGLLVLVLRSYLVFQNVYVTYKTLKIPPPSARNNGKPSIRAMTQRKRDMKGCMAIWIVWCCLAAYEAAIEGIVSIFIPFYNEIKSVILVLFILARARGAEPIYLHVIRPFLKPYVSTLDAILDIFHSIGDFILLVASIPFKWMMSWWQRRSLKSSKQAIGSDDSSHHPNHTEAPPPYEQGTASRMTSSGQLDASIAKFYGPTNPSYPIPQVWHPPASVFEEGGRIAMPTPTITTFTEPGNNLSGNVDRRSYPLGDHHRSGFHESLLLPRGPTNPSSDGGLSDDLFNSGVQHESSHANFEGFSEDDVDASLYDSDRDSFYETDEDSFNVSLRTPSRFRHRRRGRSISVGSRGVSTTSHTVIGTTGASGDSDDLSESTGLSTIRHAPTLCTTYSQSSTATSDSDAAGVHTLDRFPSRLQDPLPIGAVLRPKSGNVLKAPQKYTVHVRQTNARRDATQSTSKVDAGSRIHDSSLPIPARQRGTANSRAFARRANTPRGITSMNGGPGSRGPKGVSSSMVASTTGPTRGSSRGKTLHRGASLGIRSTNGRPASRPVPRVSEPSGL